NYYEIMGNKLGLDKVSKDDQDLIANFEKILSAVKPDMTIFYQLLIDLSGEIKEEEILNHFEDSFYQVPQENERKNFIELISNYLKRRIANNISAEESRAKMR